jgi:Tfp pilus assembly protein PilF
MSTRNNMGTTGWLLAGLLVVTAAAGPARAQEPLSAQDRRALTDANRFVERANAFVARNSLPRAKAEYEKALRIFPRHLDALYNLAVVCERLGQRDEAVGHYRRYLEVAPNDADVWTQLGVLYDAGGERAKAREAYQKAIEANPRFGRAHHNLGVLLKESGQMDDAQRHLERFVELEEQAARQTPAAYYSLGILLMERGRVREAKLLLQKAVDIDPTVAHFHNAMGDVYLLEQQYELAMAHYRRALQQDPKYAPAHSGMGEAYFQMGERAKAAESYRKALELQPGYALVHYRLGRLHEETDRAEAIKHFEIYLQSGNNLAFADEVRGRLEKLRSAAPSSNP